jgi:hypothetical protein
MPEVGFEPTIPEFERATTVHASDSVATVIGILQSCLVSFAPEGQEQEDKSYIHVWAPVTVTVYRK